MLLTILQAIIALPRLLTLLKEFVDSWKQGAADKKKENSRDEIAKEHDDLRNGDTPRAD